MVPRCPQATKPTSSSSSGVSGRCRLHPLVPQAVAATPSRLQQGATAHAASACVPAALLLLAGEDIQDLTVMSQPPGQGKSSVPDDPAIISAVRHPAELRVDC